MTSSCVHVNQCVGLPSRWVWYLYNNIEETGELGWWVCYIVCIMSRRQSIMVKKCFFSAKWGLFWGHVRITSFTYEQYLYKCGSMRCPTILWLEFLLQRMSCAAFLRCSYHFEKLLVCQTQSAATLIRHSMPCCNDNKNTNWTILQLHTTHTAEKACRWNYRCSYLWSCYQVVVRNSLLPASRVKKGMLLKVLLWWVS